MRSEEFDDIYDRYHKTVQKQVMSGTNDYQTAQDICQIVFIALNNNKQKIPLDLVKAWLINTTQHAIVDYYRKKSRNAEVLTEDFTLLSEERNILTEENVQLYERKFEDQEFIKKILRDVKSINVRWYEVIFLCFIEELSYSEAAKKLRISEQVLRASICRVRKYIRQKFGDEYYSR